MRTVRVNSPYYDPHGIVANFVFFFNDTATTEIYTLSLHDALPICSSPTRPSTWWTKRRAGCGSRSIRSPGRRSEEHTSELQSRLHLVCRLLLEKKKKVQPRGSAVRRSTPTQASYSTLADTPHQLTN